MLAFILLYGYRIWPAIFLGAFIGNTWAYADFSSVLNISRAFFAGTANGIGDVFCSVGGAYFFTRYTGTNNPFKGCQNYTYFMFFGGIAGPFVSALFGVTALCLTDFIPWQSYLFSLVTWWVGDGVGVLVVAPAILALHHLNQKEIDVFWSIEMLFFVFLLIATGYFGFMYKDWPELIPSPLYIVGIAALWSVFHLGQAVTFITVFIFTAIAVISTSLGAGPFASDNQYFSLVQLQVTVVIMTVTVFVLNALVTQRDSLIRKLEYQASRDYLTEIFNRSYFEQALEQEIYNSQRYDKTFSIFMMDVDNFKKINDDLGHQVGDQVLKYITESTAHCLRESDILARWGGEEFIVLMPNTSSEGAYQLAERCRIAIANMSAGNVNGITCSIGIATYNKSLETKAFLKQADDALYESKHHGKNRTTVCEVSNQIEAE